MSNPIMTYPIKINTPEELIIWEEFVNNRGFYSIKSYLFKVMNDSNEDVKRYK